ncbi:hypothetical protein [Streptomyces sp. PT12]|uniref:hypothetical protein n=1 Tax=Streptomyces sp. PT12 TaxID=1510197 RepID=UPI000DE35F08|nr:hypothetical protein [Streptomyces sp. PT12]RBM05662.1 hypothetical protein DEH69_28225 [Streptomyces sp. PT12]
MTRSIDQALARAILAHRPHTYTDQEIAAAETRIAARISDRLDQPPPGCPALFTGGSDDEATRYLATLCRTVVEQEGALQDMAAFLGRRIPQPYGARVLGCVLQLAGREDSARFWWQFAAGAGDCAAAYCLHLHHLTLGETWEAEFWRRQAGPGLGASDPEADADDAGIDEGVEDAYGERGADAFGYPDPYDEDEEEFGPDPGLVLRVLALLHGDDAYLTDAAAAVVHYVPSAVHFVDEVELPLPVADFVQRIEELTATA